MTDGWPSRLTAAGRRAGRVVVGDRTGLVVFLAVLVFAGALWRVGFFIQDTVTQANTLANVAEGRLALAESPYSLTLGSQTGIVHVDGQAYGRNYGHVLASLPILWVLDGLSLVANLRLVVAAGWSSLVAALGWQAARVTGRRWAEPVGVAVGLVAFVGNVLVVEPLPAPRTELMALQSSTMLAAALLATLLYRLLARFHGRRVGVAAGLGVVVATPVGFWSSIPKRHVLTAAVVVAVLYCFAVSRSDTTRRGRLARAGAYAALGLLTTVHPFEAFFLFLVLVPLDLVTAPRNDVRTVGLVAGIFLLSMLPFFVLNTLIAGHPLQAPRVLSTLDGVAGSGTTDGGGGTATPSDGRTTTPTDGGSATQTEGGNVTQTDSTTSVDDGTSSSGSGGGETPPEGSGGDSGGILPGPIASAAGLAVTLLAYAWETLVAGVDAAQETDRLYHVFVRSGDIPSVFQYINDFEMVELTLLESFPLAAALVWLPVGAARSLRRGIETTGIGTPRRQTDLLAVGFAVVFTLVYLPRLPLRSQITVRYLLPVMPLLVYGVARLPPVRQAIEEAPRWLVGGYVTTVVAGGAVVLGALLSVDPAIGEAMQFHALVGLATALVAVVVLQLWPAHEDARLLAVGLSLPAGATTVFLLFTGIEYFHYQLPGLPPGHEPFALDIVRLLAELLPLFAP